MCSPHRTSSSTPRCMITSRQHSNISRGITRSQFLDVTRRYLANLVGQEMSFYSFKTPIQGINFGFLCAFQIYLDLNSKTRIPLFQMSSLLYATQSSRFKLHYDGKPFLDLYLVILSLWDIIYFIDFNTITVSIDINP